MKASLTDICDFQGGTQPPKDEWIDQPAQGYVRMLQIRDFTQSDKNYIEYVKDTGKLKTCIEDDILIGRYGASIGKILTGLAGAYNVAIVKTIPDEKVVSKKYLYWYLNSQYFQRFINNVGSRAAQAGFNKNDLGAAQIPLVDKERQEEICEVLEKANKLISLRKQQLAKLDEGVKARFVEMFGDPVSNPLHWKKVKLSELADIKIGPFGSLLHKEDYVTGGHPLVNPSHIINGRIIVDNDLTLTEEKYFELSAYHLKENDVVLGRRGEMGRCAVVDEEGLLCGTGSLFIRTNGTVTADYIQKIISFPTFKKTIEDMAVGQTMPNLNVPIVSNFMIIVPPLSVQKDYYDFVECVDQQKQTVQQSLEKLELMKKALMQEYFG
mgnify:CR=1 FL=1